jgi:hypothetical protein
MLKNYSPLLFFFALGACQAKTSTFVVRALHFSTESAPLEFDFDQDGLDDNRLPQWNALWRALGAPVEERYQVLLAKGERSLGFDLTEDTFAGASLRGYQASLDDSGDAISRGEFFSFEETTVERPLFGEASSFLEASGERLFLPLLPFQGLEPLALPLTEVSVSGSLERDALTAGKLVGLVSAGAVAAMLEELPSALQRQQLLDALAYNEGEPPIPCEGSDDHTALVCQTTRAAGFCSDANPNGVVTGLCVGQQSISAAVLSAFDEDGDGRFLVEFDAHTGRFSQNDLSRLFDLDAATRAPRGLLGELFQIDQDQDGTPDAMAIALGFEAASAPRR